MDSAEVLTKVRKREANLAVIGLGRVGLPTALALAELGWKVIGTDADARKIDALGKGQAPFYEPGVQELLEKHVGSTRFQLTADVEEAIRKSSVLFLCVGTPQREDGQVDLSQIESLARVIAHNLNGYKLIVEKSTVPAVTGKWIQKTVERYFGAALMHHERSGAQVADTHPLSRSEVMSLEELFDVASNPEFLQEGKALENIFRPDRVICGVNTVTAKNILEELYRPLKSTVLFTDLTTAELIKHAANAFLSLKISFINMVADICEAVGADVTKVADGIGLDPRIGRSFLNAGLGFGGYCFPKDLRAFMRLAEDNNVNASLLKAVEDINQRRIEVLLNKVRKALWVVQGKTVGILGLAFKNGTDDTRESPSLKVVETLLKEGAVLQLFDPKAMPSLRESLPEQAGRISYCADAYEAAASAHAVLLLTEWDEFRELDLVHLRQKMEVPILIDARNLLDSDTVREAGFEYLCMGRPPVSSELSSAASFIGRRRTRPFSVPRQKNLAQG